MKKITFIFTVALAMLALGNTTAKAQVQGEMGAGVNFVIGTGDDYTNYGLGVKYQWTFKTICVLNLLLPISLRRT